MGVIQIHCDGGCRGNQERENIGGWGVVLEYKGSVKEIYGGTRNTTNNRMELQSCIEALKLVTDTTIPTEVTMDSQYVIKGTNEWMYGWLKKGWKTSKNKPVENKEQWLELYNLKRQFENIQFKHCYGHADNAGNNRADTLANIAMDKVKKQ